MFLVKYFFPHNYIKPPFNLTVPNKSLPHLMSQKSHPVGSFISNTAASEFLVVFLENISEQIVSQALNTQRMNGQAQIK